MKISKISKTVVENKRDTVEIKKENLIKDFEPSTEDCN